jgi:primosomal protein N'
MKAERGINLQALTRAWLAAAPLQKGVRIQVDVDPYSFL